MKKANERWEKEERARSRRESEWEETDGAGERVSGKKQTEQERE